MRVKLFTVAVLLALTGFGQTLDSIEGGTFVVTGTPDRPVFVNHSDKTVVAVAFRQQSSTRHTRINHFMGMTPDLLIEPEGQRDLLQSADTIAIRVEPGKDGIKQEAGTPIAVILDLLSLCQARSSAPIASILKPRSWIVCAGRLLPAATTESGKG